MESEILHQLEIIRAYVFIIMVAFIVWISLKAIESFQRIFIGFKKTWDTRFDNSMEKLMDIGEYDKVIEECREVLDKYPNHVDAVWYTAKAHYYKENNEESKEFFDKAIYLVPSWEETANAYIEKISNR